MSLLIDPGERGERVTDALRDSHLQTPELIQVEVANVMRRRRNGGLLANDHATAAFATPQDLPMTLWPFRAIATRVWQLGDNLSSYDACYFALAEHTSSPLVTRDARMTRTRHRTRSSGD